VFKTGIGIALVLLMNACASKGPPKVDCRGPLRPVNAALVAESGKGRPARAGVAAGGVATRGAARP